MFFQLLKTPPNGIYKICLIDMDQYIFYLNNDKNVKLFDYDLVYVALKAHWCVQ